MPDVTVADYKESLEILTKLARKGDVRAAIALAGHLRKEKTHGDDGSGSGSAIDELARRRTG